jgi:hypothetical protein
MQQVQPLFEEAPSFPQISRRFRLQDELNFLRQVFDVPELQRHRHAPARSHCVDGDRELRRLAIDRRLLEEQRLSALRRFHLAVCPFADDQVCFDRDRDPRQLACLIERLDKLPE